MLFICKLDSDLFADGLKLISSPGDQVIVIGFNNSLVSLRWTVDLEGKEFDRLKILRSPNKDLSNSDNIVLYSSSRTSKILAVYEDRMNVSFVVDNGIVSVTFMMENVTNIDEFYYQMRAEDKESKERPDTVFIAVKGKDIYSLEFLISFKDSR